MIIVSQDKKAIHNFDNILSLQIEQCNEYYGIYVYDALNDDTDLGEYKTEERAKQILQEIINFFIMNENQNKVFRMPES